MNDTEILQSINASPDGSKYQEKIRNLLLEQPKTIVVLDDDPTGTQTVHNIPVITEWTEAVLEEEVTKSPLFFILTNSRSLQKMEAKELALLIGQRLQKLAQKHQKELLVINRSDSTLRGHYPYEVDALAKGLGMEGAKHILVPAFFDGGRYTFDDVHYIKEGACFIPVGNSPFAKDNTFGFKASNLKDWIIEKSEGAVQKEAIQGISVDQLRSSSTKEIMGLVAEQGKSHIVVNATGFADLQSMALACLSMKQPFILRTAASFVNAIGDVEPTACLEKQQLLNGTEQKAGALFVVGSYVPKTTEQLHHLMRNSKASFLELNTNDVLKGQKFEEQLAQLSETINSELEAKRDVVLYTSRKVEKGATKSESLEIVNKVSKGVLSLVQRLNVRPNYILAKGGITSSDIATRALNVKRANILGQVVKGVPVWKLAGESKFPDLSYIVFPGNVGNKGSLTEIMKKLQ